MERRIKAICIGPAVHDVVRKSISGEVHSVFDRTFNVLASGKLVGIARSDVARSPINVITDVRPSESMLSLGVRKGMRVQTVGNRVLVGGVLEISLESAELWRPKTRAEGCLGPELIKRNLELAKRLAANKGRRDGLGQLLKHIDEIAAGEMPQTSDLNMVARTVLPRLIDLVKATQSESVEGVKVAAQKLIGLGPGLSPSADDAMSGFTASLWWASHSLNKDIDLVKKINETVAKSSSTTTLLSQQLLRHAAKGETNERVGGLLEAILAGTAPDVERRVEEVLQIGETSGIDMTVGLLLGVQLGLEMEGYHELQQPG
ncbi:MAG: DUF2877 domain-containing protein [Candidatus Hadarchaeaceae archaeon]